LTSAVSSGSVDASSTTATRTHYRPGSVQVNPKIVNHLVREDIPDLCRIARLMDVPTTAELADCAGGVPPPSSTAKPARSAAKHD
jgi:hypothetical protein